jgi:hypothetical protein
MKLIHFQTISLLILLSPLPARALIDVSLGNDPVQDSNWPPGCLEIANLERRLGYWVGPPLGGGEYHFEYRGETADFQQALDLLAKLDAPERLLVIHEGPALSTFLTEKNNDKTKARYDWGFVVWDKASYERLFQNKKSSFMARDPNFGKPMPGPQIDLYLGGAPAGEGVDFSQITLPKNVKVTDERASANGYPAGTGSVLRGRVTDSTTKEPVPGIRILVTNWVAEKQTYENVVATKTGPEGKFEITGVPPGASYRVHVEGASHAPRLVGYAAFGKDTLKDFPDIQVVTSATLAGSLIGPDGKGIPNVKVFAVDVIGPDGLGYIAPAESPTTTDANGHFALTSLPAGSCRLIVQAPGYHLVEPLKNYTIPSTVELRMIQTGNVRGKVTDSGGAPDVPYMAEISPEAGRKTGSWSGGSQVKADGSFEFKGVPPGKYLVTAHPNPGPVIRGKDPNEKLIEVKGGETVEVEIKVK